MTARERWQETWRMVRCGALGTLHCTRTREIAEFAMDACFNRFIGYTLGHLTANSLERVTRMNNRRRYLCFTMAKKGFYAPLPECAKFRA